jgi:hypothetical protein
MKLIAEGCTNKEIATTLNVTLKISGDTTSNANEAARTWHGPRIHETLGTDKLIGAIGAGGARRSRQAEANRTRPGPNTKHLPVAR